MLTDLARTVFDESAARNERNDCAVKAAALTMGIPYAKVHATFQKNGRKHRRGTKWSTFFQSIKDLGFVLVDVTAEFPKTTIRSLEPHIRRRSGESFIIHTRSHVVAAKEGSIHDWTRGRLHRPKHIWKLYRAGEAIPETVPHPRLAYLGFPRVIVAPTIVRPIVAPVAVKTRKGRATVLGYSATAVAKWAGKQGWTYDQCYRMIVSLAVGNVTASTIRTGWADGRNPKYNGNAACPTAEEIETMERAR